MRRDPRGDMNGRHRRDEHKFYGDVEYPLDLGMFRPLQILGSASKSVEGAGIRVASLVDGKAAFLNHVGMVLRWDPRMKVPYPRSGLVVSEAVYPVHAYTSIEAYMAAMRRGECRLTLMDIDPVVWGGDVEMRYQAEQACIEYHIGLKGAKYCVKIFFPLAAYSFLRNTTPFIRGRFENIITKKLTKIFICSNNIDSSLEVAQVMLQIDLFLSSLHKYITTPQDIFAGPFTRFLGGVRREEIQPKYKIVGSDIRNETQRIYFGSEILAQRGFLGRSEIIRSQANRRI